MRKAAFTWISKKNATLEDPLAVMIWIKHWIKDFFGFSRAQVNGFIVLLPLVTFFIFSESLWHWWISRREIDYKADQARLDSLVASWNIEKSKDEESATERPKKPEFFVFDPNRSSPSDFIALGFSQNLISRIIHYREKGGKFRIKTDLLKIYGFDSTFYHQLRPFVSLPEKTQKVEWKEKFQKKDVLTKKVPLEKFDLNQADTSQLKKINGIGEKLSVRIIKYRDILGGFVTMSQLKEVYGLDSLVVNRLSRDAFLDKDFQPVRININTAEEKQLSAHPYLIKVARAIIAYRFQHGKFKTLEDIRHVGSLDETTIKKITPYLKVSDEL